MAKRGRKKTRRYSKKGVMGMGLPMLLALGFGGWFIYDRYIKKDSAVVARR